MTITLRDILSGKSPTIVSIEPEATLDEAVARLCEHRIGALLVCRPEGGSARLVGIITERDLLYAHASRKGAFGELRVCDTMTEKLFTGTPDDSLDQVLALMTVKRIRHLPVLESDRLVGVVSIGDLVKAQVEHLSVENRFLQDYIRG
ncbi:MAG: CBS domain-containing protein [Planctomycetota bacterium]